MRTDRPDPVILRDDAGIRAANDVARRLKEALARENHIVIDTAGVTAADLTTVQTLLAARKTARAAGGEVTLGAPLGPPLVAVLHACGLVAEGQPDAGFWPLAAPGARVEAVP